MITRRITKPLQTIVLFLMLNFLLQLGSVLFWSSEAAADTRYVNPSAEVVVRTGEGNQYKIIDMVKDGDTVDLLQVSDSYALVRLADGKEGWMLKRYLSTEPPSSVLVKSLRTENEKLKQKTEELTTNLQEVTSNLNRTQTDLQSILDERDQIKNDYQKLQEDTADVVKIKTEMEAATAKNNALGQEMASLREENDKLKKDKSINWFIAGGGVLLVGMFIGRLTSKSRKRKSSLI